MLWTLAQWMLTDTKENYYFILILESQIFKKSEKHKTVTPAVQMIHSNLNKSKRKYIKEATNEMCYSEIIYILLDLITKHKECNIELN